MSEGYLSGILSEIAAASSRDKTAASDADASKNLLQSSGSPATIPDVTQLARKFAASIREAPEPLSVRTALQPWTGNE